MSSRRALIGSLAAVALVVTASSAPVSAHAVLVKSIPAARAVLGHQPEQVELWFNERLEPAFSTVSVWSAAGVQVDRRDIRVAHDDPKRLSVTLPPVEVGTYTVRFRVLSVDGHIIEASFSFTVKANR